MLLKNILFGFFLMFLNSAIAQTMTKQEKATDSKTNFLFSNIPIIIDSLSVSIGSESTCLKYGNMFVNAKDEKQISKVSANILDTLKQNGNSSFYKRVLTYLRTGNVKEAFAVIKLPININSGISSSLNYGWEILLNFRIHNDLFFEYETSDNFGNNKKIDVQKLAFNVTNEFIFNKTGHAIILTPYFGYMLFIISHGVNEVDYNSFGFGLRGSFKLTQKSAFFLSSSYNTANSTQNLNGFNITPTHYSVAFGIIFTH
jgi:hypothetical protein